MAKKQQMVKISDVLLKIAKKFDLEIKVVEHNINRQWAKIVGDKISTHTRPDTVSYRRLIVYVDSPAWMQQLTFLKEDIIKKINDAAGRQIIKDVKFRIGDVAKDAEMSDSDMPDKKIEFRPLTKNDLVFSEEVTKPIGDEDIRGKAKKAIIKYLTAKSKK